MGRGRIHHEPVPVKTQADRDRELELGQKGTAFRFWFGVGGLAVRREWVRVRGRFAANVGGITFDLARLAHRRNVDLPRVVAATRALIDAEILEGELQAGDLVRVSRWNATKVQRHPALTPSPGDVGARWGPEVSESTADAEPEILGMPGWWRHISTTHEALTYRTLTEREVVAVEGGHVTFVVRPVLARQGTCIELLGAEDLTVALRLGPARQRHRVPLARWQVWARVAWSPRGGPVVPAEVRRG